MFQIQKGIFWEYFQNFPRLPIYGFAHAKVKKSIFISKIQIEIQNLRAEPEEEIRDFMFLYPISMLQYFHVGKI